MEVTKLYTGAALPKLGFGTWQVPAEVATESVAHAIATGFRHIDCAAAYENEPQVGAGIKKGLEACGLQRSDLFITSKVWNTNRGYDKTMKSFDKTLEDLGLEYLDLFLIHWPANPFQFDNWKELNLDTWRAMEQCVRDGRVRAIGLSNFMPRHMIPLLDKVEIAPAVDQIEYHPGWTQKECVDFCREHNIAVEAWSPLGQGSALTHPLIVELAAKYEATPSQVVLNWVIGNDIVALTRSIKPERIDENFASAGFQLSSDDAARISALNSFGGKCRNPDLVPY